MTTTSRPARAAVPPLALALLGGLLAAACTSTQPAPPPPPPKFPDEWRLVDLTRPLDAGAAFVAHPEAFPFNHIDFSPPPGEASAWSLGAYTAVDQMGTHLAAPRARAAAGRTVEAVPASDLLAEAVVVEIPEGPDVATELTADHLRVHERLHGEIPAGSLVLLRTGHGGLSSSDPAYAPHTAEKGFDYPGFSAAAVTFLIETRRVRAIGTDGLTIDAGAQVARAPAQAAAARAGLWCLANLADLRELPARGAQVVVGVLPLVGASGAQARVVAFVPPAPPPRSVPRGPEGSSP
jgi:kynurenine formamidase